MQARRRDRHVVGSFATRTVARAQRSQGKRSFFGAQHMAARMPGPCCSALSSSTRHRDDALRHRVGCNPAARNRRRHNIGSAAVKPLPFQRQRYGASGLSTNSHSRPPAQAPRAFLEHARPCASPRATCCQPPGPRIVGQRHGNWHLTEPCHWSRLAHPQSVPFQFDADTVGPSHIQGCPGRSRGMPHRIDFAQEQDTATAELNQSVVGQVDR